MNDRAAAALLDLGGRSLETSFDGRAGADVGVVDP